jgi:hypothetical protein
VARRKITRAKRKPMTAPVPTRPNRTIFDSRKQDTLGITKRAAPQLPRKESRFSMIRQARASDAEPEGVKQFAKLLTGILGTCASAASAGKILDLSTIGSRFGLDMVATSLGVNNAFDEFVEVMAPRDSLEKLALEQLLLNHIRVLSLSQQACAQSSPEMVKILNEATDRASGAFRRLMSTFADYRKPRQQQFVAIGQANVAGQQIVHNIGDAKQEKSSNELESKSAKAPRCQEDTG